MIIINKLFDLKFYNNNISILLKELESLINSNNKATIFTPNIDHIINNKKDEVKNIYKQSEYIVADGWPIVATGRLKGEKIYRITGVDLMDGLLKLADINEYSVFFLGATDETLIKIKKNLKEEYRNIKSISFHNGYFHDNKKVIDNINKSKSNILFVGMGNPKQELWIRENMDKLNVNLILGVGGAFKIFSNEVKRAPNFVQLIGMEWFYRFLKEPRRLFFRYFIKYPQFIKIFFNEMFVRRKYE